MNADAPPLLEPDRGQIDQFVSLIFTHVTVGYVSLSARRAANAVVGGDTRNGHPLRWLGWLHRRAEPRLYKIIQTPRYDRKGSHANAGRRYRERLKGRRDAERA